MSERAEMQLREALALAADAGVSVRYADLGDWGEAGALLAEYDRAARSIALNARVAARLERARGAACAARFATAAILHELHHHRRPDAGEAAAHAFARAAGGLDPREFESILRAEIAP
jgi:hypothetical protein